MKWLNQKLECTINEANLCIVLIYGVIKSRKKILVTLEMPDAIRAGIITNPTIFCKQLALCYQQQPRLPRKVTVVTANFEGLSRDLELLQTLRLALIFAKVGLTVDGIYGSDQQRGESYNKLSLFTPTPILKQRWLLVGFIFLGVMWYGSDQLFEQLTAHHQQNAEQLEHKRNRFQATTDDVASLSKTLEHQKDFVCKASSVVACQEQNELMMSIIQSLADGASPGVQLTSVTIGQSQDQKKDSTIQESLSLTVIGLAFNAGPAYELLHALKKNHCPGARLKLHKQDHGIYTMTIIGAVRDSHCEAT